MGPCVRGDDERFSPRPDCGERSRASCERVRGLSTGSYLRIVPLTRRLCFAPSPTSTRKRGEVAFHTVIASAGEAIHLATRNKSGLHREACHRARIRATRWLAMTARYHTP